MLDETFELIGAHRQHVLVDVILLIVTCDDTIGERVRAIEHALEVACEILSRAQIFAQLVVTTLELLVVATQVAQLVLSYFRLMSQLVVRFFQRADLFLQLVDLLDLLLVAFDSRVQLADFHVFFVQEVFHRSKCRCTFYAFEK